MESSSAIEACFTEVRDAHRKGSGQGLGPFEFVDAAGSRCFEGAATPCDAKPCMSVTRV